jgi:hypothetical protein
MSAVASYLAASCYVTLAAAHSYFGERELIAPLVRARWEVPTLPRRFAATLLRCAWHLLSVAWLAAAAILVLAANVPTARAATDVLAALALLSGAAILLPGRGAHPAWAVFALGGAAALVAAHGWPGAAVARGAGAGATAVLVALAALHGYWAAGGRRGLAAAIPTTPDGRAAFAPPPALTLLVALGLAAAALVVASAAGLGPAVPGARGLGLALVGVFGLRVVGDFRFSGLFRRVHGSAFARLDAALYTPLCAALAGACLLAAR